MKTTANSSKKKRIAIPIASIGIIGVIVATVVTLAANSKEYRSFEYIEKLKAKYEFQPLQILEIAPSKTESQFGYLVEGCEPCGDWKEIASMYENKREREQYIKKLFQNLERANLLSSTPDAAPLLKTADYIESYPWTRTPQTTDEMKLQFAETVSTKGEMVKDENHNGEYNGNFSYSLEANNFKNCFNFIDFKNNSIAKLHLTKLNVGKGIRNDASKVFALDLTNKSVIVFGSTEENWKNYGDYDYYYDLASVYKNKNYYTLDGIEKGKTYCLNFEATVANGKGQVTIIPLDRAGNPIYYSPNYSNQYWYWSQYFASSGEGNPYSYQFTIPSRSNVAKVQVRFDVSEIETAAVIKNISVYEYNESGSLFKYGANGGYRSPLATVDSNKETVTVTANAGATTLDTYPNGNSSSRWYAERGLSNLYTLTYHVENSGGRSKVVIYELDENNNIVQTVEQEQNASGTYSLNLKVNENVKKFGVAFGAVAGSKQLKVVYSNISFTAYQDFEGTARATHVQVYDHFFTGSPTAVLSEENSFDYSRWFASGSNVKKYSEQPGDVTSYEDGVIIVKNGSSTNQSTNYSDTRYIASEMLYYIPVDGNAYYEFSFRPISDDDVTYGVYFSNEDRNNIKTTGYPKTIKVNDEGPSTSDLDENGFYKVRFKTPGSARYVQVSFGLTKKNQQASFDHISLYEMVVPKAYYYNLKFTRKSVAELDPNVDAGLALYSLSDYKYEGEKGTFDEDPSKIYYYIENVNGRYIPAPSTIADGTPLYTRGKYYVWQGNYGEGDFYVDKDGEYFTAEINYDGYVEATAENVSAGCALFRLDEDGTSYILEDTYEGGTVPENMYIRSTPVSETMDAVHPYYLPEEEFREADIAAGEIPLFIANLNYYVYVGAGGEYNYQNGTDEVVIQTDTVFYAGGFKNNNWFKRFVLDCDRTDPDELQEQLDKVQVNVVVLTPAALNLLEYTDINPENSELVTAVGSYELAVISNGFDISKNKPAEFDADITSDVLNVLKKRLLMDDRSDKEYIPVAIDLEMLDSSKSNLKALAEAICTDTKSDNTTFVNEEPGLGSNDYIYRFDGTDLPTARSFIVNDKMLANFDQEKYITEDAPYSKVYKLIRQENLVRRNGKKYYELPEEVDEANIIRHILNYRGRRVLLNKATVNILEIEPMTNASVLYAKEEDKSESKVIDVRRWFTTNTEVYDSYAKEAEELYNTESARISYLNDKRALRYSYVDNDGNAQEGITKFVITTMAPHEVAGKIEDLAENYDLVYVGTSLEGFDKLITYCGTQQEVSTLSGQDHASNMSFVYREEDRADKGDVVPDYNDDTQDGFYYSSTGDIFRSSGDGFLARSKIGGMLYDDYTIVGKTIGEFFGADSSNLPWYVNSSDCDLRDSGNDITDTKMEELKAFIQQGLPVIVGDNICLQDYDGNLKVKILGKTYYQRAGRDVYLPGHEGDEKFKFTAQDNEIHVCLCAEVAGDLPDGIQVDECTWYHDGIEIPTDYSRKLLFPRLREWLGLPTTQEYNNQDYRKIDTDGDGIYDLFCFDFVPGEKKESGEILCPENGEYYCSVNFDFSNCRSALGAPLRYNGLYGETNEANILSNRIHVFPEDRVYNIHYLDYTDNLTYRLKYGSIINSFEYKPGVPYKTISISQMFLVTEPIPEDANDNVLYRAIATHHWSYSWREVTCEWMNAGDENLTYEDGDRRVTYKERINGSALYWHSVYYDTYLRVYRDRTISDKGAEIVCYSNEDGDSMINKGFCCYFNDEGNEARASRVSAGGYGTFNIQYSGTDDRTYTVHGYKLALLDANNNLVPMAQGYKDADGGYTLTGKDQYGNDVYGLTSNIKTNAMILKKRIDNCSNLYDVLSTTLGNEEIENVFTENQVERKDGAFREILTQYVNFSEPIVKVLNKPAEYPEYDSLPNNTVSMSFQVTNETDEDTVNARYNCRFYIDENGDGQFSPIEEAQATITGSTDNGAGGLRTTSKASGTHNYTLYYKFGKEETGFKPCRLMVSKVGEEGAHGSYYFNVFVAPQKKPDGTDDHDVIEAIQILPGDWDPWYASIQNPPPGYNQHKWFKGESKNVCYSDNQWKGSVFLSDVFTRSEITNINSDVTIDNGKWNKGTTMTRTIYYKDGSHDNPNAKYVYDESKDLDYVNFRITSSSGIVYLDINIHFTNISKVDSAYNTDDGGASVKELDLESYDLLFMGYGDSYGKLGLGRTESAVGSLETIGYNQNASLAIERMIENGIPVIFCHDTILPNVNFINYWLNDVGSWANNVANNVGNFLVDLGNKIKNFFSGNGFSNNEDYNKYNNEIHTSRIKNGYYANLILRDPLCQDRYGISYKIKERCGYVYNDRELKRGHSYNNLYENTRGNKGVQENGDFWYYDGNTASNKSQLYFDKNGNAKNLGYNEWKAIYRSLKTAEEKDRFAQLQKSKGAKAVISYNILMMEEKGYCISWIPGTNKTQTDCFAHGFTSYAVHRFAKGAKQPTYTNRVSQVNRGQMTTYPYYINDDMEYDSNTGQYGETQISMADAFYENGMMHGRYEVMKTHEQYFQVNINKNSDGEGATVWYCLAPGTGSYSGNFADTVRNDCENAYFIYTKGNVTYTGAGHSNNFTVFEAKMFLCAIAAAQRTEAKAPNISFYEPEDEAEEEMTIYKPTTYGVLIKELNKGAENSTDVYVDPTTNTAIWKKTLCFRIANTSASQDNAEFRTIGIFLEQEEITDSVTIYDDAGETVDKSQIKAGVYYHFDLPDKVYKKFVDDDTAIANIYVRVYDDSISEYTLVNPDNSIYRDENGRGYIMTMNEDGSGYIPAYYIEKDAEGNDLVKDLTNTIVNYYDEDNYMTIIRLENGELQIQGDNKGGYKSAMMTLSIPEAFDLE